MMFAAEVGDIALGGGLTAAVLTAFGYAIALMRAGTDRSDATAAKLVAAAEGERDRAREEAARERQASVEAIGAADERHQAELRRLEAEVTFWRDRALGQTAPHPDTQPPPAAIGPGESA